MYVCYYWHSGRGSFSLARVLVLVNSSTASRRAGNCDLLLKGGIRIYCMLAIPALEEKRRECTGVVVVVVVAATGESSIPL